MRENQGKLFSKWLKIQGFFSVSIRLNPAYSFLLHFSAINICFGEKEVYTQEVLAVVIQQLIDISPLPTLFMRTVRI